MPQPSVFDPPPGVMKGDGQMHPTGVGNQMPAGAQMMPQASAPATAAQPGVGNAIQTLIAALASAFAPKSITQAPQREKVQEEAAGLGDQLK